MLNNNEQYTLARFLLSGLWFSVCYVATFASAARVSRINRKRLNRTTSPLYRIRHTYSLAFRHAWPR